MPIINGTSGDDRIISTQGDDTVSGGAGNDTITDQWGDDIIDGGDGDDVIVDEGGNNTIRGGAGNDRITVSDIFAWSASTIGIQYRTNVIDAGTGNDLVTVGAFYSGSLTVDLGDGNDILRLTRAVQIDHSFTLGAGQDRVVLDYDFGNSARSAPPVVTIVDFTAGTGGDILDLGEFLRGYYNNATSYSALLTDANPFVNGVLVLVQDGADTLVQVDYDGSKGNVIQPFTFLRLENVNAASLTAENFGGWDPSGAGYSVPTINGTALDDLILVSPIRAVVNAGDGNDEIIGNWQTDEINGGDGDDLIDGGGGDDILRGGNGNDTIRDAYGNDTIDAGAGDDFIDLIRPWADGSNSTTNGTVTVDGGDGNDYLRYGVGSSTASNRVTRAGVLIADMGAGDDTIELLAPQNNSNIPLSTLTLGAGRDRLIVDILGNPLNVQITITDFEAGDTGDILDLAKMILGSQGWDLFSNPFATGHLYLVQSGADTLVRWDYDGTGGGAGNGYEYTLVTLQGVDASTLTAANFDGFDPSGAASTAAIPSGTAGNDRLTGSFADDVINGGDGDDYIEETFGGSDTISGGAGNDTIIVDHRYHPRPASIAVNGNAGQDYVYFSVYEGSGELVDARINLGSGDDRLVLRTLVQGGTRLTLGPGSDVVEFASELAAESLGALVITDFETGPGGDRIDWNLFVADELSNGTPGYNPFVEGQMQLVQDGSNALLQYRPNGTSAPFQTLITFLNTSIYDFTADNLGYATNLPTVPSTDGDDVLDGSAVDDIIYGGAGNDAINGFAGFDNLYGEDGDDTIDGGDDDDFVQGGLGDDTIYGGSGNDILLGGAGVDRVFGDGGNDEIEDSDGIDRINGGAGNDTITVNLSYSALIDNNIAAGSVLGGGGNDVVTITNAGVGTTETTDPDSPDVFFIPNYTVNLGAGDDRLITDGHFGTITLGTGRDVIEFVPGPDSFGSVVTDFQTGAAGDVVDFTNMFSAAFDVAVSAVADLLINGANPFEIGVFELRQNGSDVDLILIPSVSGNFSDILFMTFENTNVADFTPENFAGFDPHVTPAVPTYITSNLTIGASQTIVTSNIVPDDSVAAYSSSHFVMRGNGNIVFRNNGELIMYGDTPGYGIPIGFAVSRFSDPGPNALFHNTATGNFIVAYDIDPLPGLVASGPSVYGFYAPQQGVNFLNDGYFEVTAIDGDAYGIVNGFDTTAIRTVTNNGTIVVASDNAGAFGIRLGAFSGFENTGDIFALAPEFAVGVYWSGYQGGSFNNSGTLYAQTDPSSPYAAIGLYLVEGNQGTQDRRIVNSGLLSADIAILVGDTSRATPYAETVINTGVIEGAIFLGAGNDEVTNRSGGQIFGPIYLEAGNDFYNGVGGQQLGGVHGGPGADTYRINSLSTVLVENPFEGSDTVESYLSYTLAANFENLTLLGTADLVGTGNGVGNRMIGNSGNNTLDGGAGGDTIDGGAGLDILIGGAGNDTLEGGSNIDTAVFTGHSSRYTITQTSSGVFEISGPDGTDTLTGVEFAQFGNTAIRLLPGEGVTVDFSGNDPADYAAAMEGIRDFDGNDLGGDGAWVWIGSADVNGDGDVDQILVNAEIGRFATLGTADDGLVYFDDYGWAGETRVAGIYIDPLVESGDVEAGGPNDSQRRFQNDLEIGNISEVLGADDYDGDGLQEIYFALNDGTAYLHAYMHADGNIRYANYQSEQQVIDFLTANGFDESTWAGWFPSTQESPNEKGSESAEGGAANQLGVVPAAVFGFDPWHEQGDEGLLNASFLAANQMELPYVQLAESFA